PLGVGEGGVAAPAFATARHHRRLADGHQVRQPLAGVHVEGDGADRYVDDEILAAGSGLVAPFALATGLRPELRTPDQLVEGRHVVDGAQEHGAAATAVAAIGTALRDVLQAQEGEGPVAALPALHVDLEYVTKRHA